MMQSEEEEDNKNQKEIFSEIVTTYLHVIKTRFNVIFMEIGVDHFRSI